MKFWTRKENPAQPSGHPIFDLPPTWFQTLTSPDVLPRVAILLGLLVAALLIVQLPRTPLPVRKGERTTHPILARVEFSYVDQDVTTTVRNLAALVRVPSVYDSEPRQVAAMKDSLVALAAAAAKAAALEQLPEAVQKEWKITPETFAALKVALGEKSENLPAVQETLTKAMTTLAEPTNLPIVSDEGFHRHQGTARSAACGSLARGRPDPRRAAAHRYRRDASGRPHGSHPGLPDGGAD
jgi:hypothetical protein